MDFAQFLLDNRLRSLEIAKYLDITEPSVSRWKNGRDVMSQRHLDKLLHNPYGWNTSALQSPSINVTSKVSGHSSNSVSIKGCLNSSPSSSKAEPTKMIPIVQLNDVIDSEAKSNQIASPIPSATLAVRITGNVMEPKYKHGDVVYCLRVNEKAFIEWGCIYALDTENGIIIRRVERGNKETEIRCVSINGKLAPIDIDMKYVNGWYKVIGSLTFE